MAALHKLAVLGTLISGLGTSALAQETDPILEVLRQEIARTTSALESAPEPLYFLSYEITETEKRSLVGSFGTLVSRDRSRTRLLDIDLRLGSYELDNTHPVRGDFEGFGFFGGYSYVPMPLDAGSSAMRALLWHHTDAKYKKARERLTRIVTNVRVKVEEEDRSADFSREEPEIFLEDPVTLDFDAAAWEEKIRRYTAPFAAYAEIYQARAWVEAVVERRWFASSEGARVRTARPRFRLLISAVTKAEDGMELPRYESFYATSAGGLGEDDAVLAAVERIIGDLLALREAPVVDPYTGPALLSGRAAGVFFHEVFGHRVEGHRQKSESEGQTFKKKVGERVLPASFSVIFDPTAPSYFERELAGFYRFDNQGVRSRRVPVVEGGVLQGFLTSRAPIEGFSRSNGHGRKEPGFAPVARQSNLLVEVAGGASPGELKRRLIELVREQDKPYGLRFEDIQGGFTLTGRTLPNAFNVLPILVYRVYPDGREELVRGVDLIGTPLTAFSRILAADREVEVFNGICGAESGGVPVSAVSPGLLVGQIEVQKKEKSQERAPLLAAPLVPTPLVSEGSGGGR